MTSRDFCFWLQGYLEIGKASSDSRHMDTLSSGQVECIQKHLNLVFKHEIDPAMGGKSHQDALNDIHNRPPLKTPNGEVLLRC